MAGSFHRLADARRQAIEISIDGDRLQVLDGDTVLTAILLHRDHLRASDIGAEPRAGFCLMGACQDCWVSDGDGRRLRACTTYVRPGLAIVTGRREVAATPVDTADLETVPIPPGAGPGGTVAETMTDSDTTDSDTTDSETTGPAVDAIMAAPDETDTGSGGAKSGDKGHP